MHKGIQQPEVVCLRRDGHSLPSDNLPVKQESTLYSIVKLKSIKQIMHIEDHSACFNYDTNRNPVIELQEYTSGESIKSKNHLAKIILVLKGEIEISYGKFFNHKVALGQLFLLPPQCQHRINFNKETSLLSYQFRLVTHLRESYNLDFLKSKFTQHVSNDFITLRIKKELNSFIDHQTVLLQHRTMCKVLTQMKIKELFYLLALYYPPEQLALLFNPVISHDISFSSLILDNYKNIKNVKQLADICHYSLSGFIKRFNKTFGTSPYRWLKQQKAELILHELKAKEKPLKEICREYGFSSASYFHTFCKQEFGKTPTQIRKGDGL